MSNKYRLGIDLGGTKIEGVVLGDNGQELFRERIDTEQENGYQHILNNIKKVYDVMVKHIDNQAHTFGIGTPGVTSRRTGFLKNSNTLCMNGKPVKKDLETLLQHPIGIQNDANCFAMAEALLGAGKGKNLVFGVIIGTGCGGGIVFNGQVITGLQSIGGEWGHMTIDPNGPNCYCGKKGCTETFISGGGAERLYKNIYGEELKLKKITENYRLGESKATEFMKQFFVNFGRAMSNLINILDPDIIVLGGGASNVAEIYTEGIKEVQKYVFNDRLETPIVQFKLGDSAGVIGAALIGI
ncbi:MAG: ROK family protein [Chitinophagales bacterium]